MHIDPALVVAEAARILDRDLNDPEFMQRFNDCMRRAG